MEFYRTSLCERHSTASSTKESFGRSLKSLKAILATSFFCGYGPALILWRLCFVIVPCSVGAVRGHGTVALKIEFWFLLRWHVTARIDLCLA